MVLGDILMSIFKKVVWNIGIGIILTLPCVATALAQSVAETKILEMLRDEKSYHVVSPENFEQLGWELPDGGQTVKVIADAAPGGTFDPRHLEKLSPDVIGYQARWHELRYEQYGLDWDITGLHLIPKQPVNDMPTLVIIHGGSSNWYEFFVDPFNEPGLGQYLAQKIPVLLVNIPGNHRHGGWTEKVLENRIPGYLLDRDVTGEELKLRNAAYTFQLVANGVEKLLQSFTSGPVVIVGHSTAGELPFMLHHSSLRDRMQGRILGWGSGGTSSQKAMQDRWGYTSSPDSYPPVQELRPRQTSGYAGDYLGPLNPAWDPDKSRREIAEIWMGEQEFRRRPHFKQPLQDIERRGAIPGMQEGIVSQVQQILTDNQFGIDTNAVIGDLFALINLQLTGYEKMIWTTATLDSGHWNADNPDNASTLEVANEFRRINPNAQIRVLLFDVPMTHYGHIERPRELAGGLFAALQWLLQP